MSQFHAQSVLNSDSFFQDAISTLASERVLSSTSIRFPWLEDIQFRTETRDMEFNLQEYTLRLSPSTRSIMKAQQSLLSHYQSEPDAEQAKAEGEMMLQLYVDWLGLYMMEQELSLIQEMDRIFSDRKKVLEKQLGSGEVNVKQLVDLTVERNRMDQSRYELEMERQALMNVYGISDGTSSFSFSDLIDIEGIEKALGEMKLMSPDLVSAKGTDPVYMYEQAGIAKEIAMEEAEGKQYLDFLQIRYRGPHDDLFKERVAIGLGIQWPNSGNRKLKIEELKMEQRQLEYDYGLELSERAERLRSYYSELELKLAIADHFIALSKEEATELDGLVGLIQKRVGYDPMTILDINQHKLEMQIKALEYLEDVYLEYIKMVSFSGKMTASPFVNYLKA